MNRNQFATHKYPCLDVVIKPLPSVTATSKVKAAFIVESIWDSNKYPVLDIAFLDGTIQQKEFVEKIVKTHLQPLIHSIRFNFKSSSSSSDPKTSPIRITFVGKGQAWSAIGNQALLIKGTSPTMNLGWLDDDTDYDVLAYRGTGQVILHEFGHLLGMIHEHQNPKGTGIKWNKPVVYKALARSNRWTKQQVDDNMFKRYGDYEMCKKHPDDKNYCFGELVNGSVFDPHSIMEYFFPKEWVLSGGEIPINTQYSDLDKEWLQKYYSKENFSLTTFKFQNYVALTIILLYICLLSKRIKN